MTGVGILGQGAKINGHNLVISKCGQYTVACNIGGQYSFFTAHLPITGIMEDDLPHQYF